VGTSEITTGVDETALHIRASGSSPSNGFLTDYAKKPWKTEEHRENVNGSFRWKDGMLENTRENHGNPGAGLWP
jgi:hypothetical protein